MKQETGQAAAVRLTPREGALQAPPPPPGHTPSGLMPPRLSLPERVVSPDSLTDKLRNSLVAIKLPTRQVEFMALPPPAPATSGPQKVPEAFRVPSTYGTWQSQQQLLDGWTHAGIALTALLAGYVAGSWHAALVHPVGHARPAPIVAPTGAEQKELDAAFAALRSARYAEARALFGALVHKHPQWASLNTQIARTAWGENDLSNFEKIIAQGENSGAIPVADGRFLLGQQSLSAKEFEDADRFLGESAGADPSRAETYFFWGECLLRWGQPNRAIEKFRTGQLLNLNPTTANLYQTKLWLAEVESGLETTDGSAERIDRALAAERPTSSALFAGAARAIKAGQYAQAANFLTWARQVSEPATFRAMLEDLYFSEESWRPELTALYVETFKQPVPLAKASPTLPDKAAEPDKHP